MKSRPALESFVGNTQAVGHVRAIIESGQLPATTLFIGPPGTGKTTLARILASNFAPPQSIVEHDSANLSGVEYGRQLAKLAETPPFAGDFRVFILDEVQRATPHFFDALLKPMEEARYARFILCTTDFSFPSKFPTISSRAVKIKTRTLTKEETRVLIARKLGKKRATPQLTSLVWELTGGSPRDIILACGEIDRLGPEKGLIYLQEQFFIKKGGNVSKFALALLSSKTTDEELEKLFYSIQDKIQARPEEVRLVIKQKLEEAIRTKTLPISKLFSLAPAIPILDELTREWYSYLDAVKAIVKIRRSIYGG